MAPRPRKARKTQEDNSTVMLMLGLFLILLAFFILLNAISELVEERVEAASEGVMTGFGFKKATTQMPNPDQLDIHKVHDRVAEKIKQTMETYLSIKDFRLERGTPETTIVHLNPSRFFERGQWRIKSSQAAFFQDLSDLVAAQNPGYHMTVDIRMPERDERIDPEKNTREADNPLVLGGYRATQFARAMIERGVEPKHLTTGVSEEQNSRIMMVFRSVITDRASALRSLRNGGAR